MINETTPNYRNLSTAELRALVKSGDQVAFDYLKARHSLTYEHPVKVIAQRVGIPPVGVKF